MQSIESDGIERSYRLYVPVGYEPGAPTPLVLNFHGFGANALEQERYAEMPTAADKYGFIVATPEGTGQPAGAGTSTGRWKTATSTTSPSSTS